MRTEARIGRPFTIAPALAQLCHGAVLKTPSGMTYTGEESKTVSVDWSGSSEGELALTIAFDYEQMLESAKAQGLDASALNVVSVGTIPIIRHSVVLFDQPLTTLEAGVAVIDLTEGSSVQFIQALETNGGVIVSTYLALASTVPASGRNPHLAGTWLSRSKFTFGTSERGVSYSLYPLTEKQFGVGVAKKAQSYVEIIGTLSIDPADAIQVTVFVNKVLLGKLSTVDVPASKAVKLKLECDVIAALLNKLCRECSTEGIVEWEKFAAAETSTGVFLVTNLSRIMNASEAEVFDMVVSGETEIILTHLQSALRVLESDLATLTPQQSEED